MLYVFMKTNVSRDEVSHFYCLARARGKSGEEMSSGRSLFDTQYGQQPNTHVSQLYNKRYQNSLMNNLCNCIVVWLVQRFLWIFLYVHGYEPKTTCRRVNDMCRGTSCLV